MVQDIDIPRAIWCKNIADLKGNITRKKPIHISGYLVKFPRKLIKIHKDIFMTADILFVHGIPFYLCHSESSNLQEIQQSI